MDDGALYCKTIHQCSRKAYLTKKERFREYYPKNVDEIDSISISILILFFPVHFGGTKLPNKFLIGVSGHLGMS